MAIQEVPAGYANEASQIIEEARIAGVYPELPPLTARDPRLKTGRPKTCGSLIPVDSSIG